MSENITSIDQRRAQRKRANFTAVVTDVISGQPIGHLGNLSANGMLLISAHPPRSEAIYQVSLSLPGLGSAPQSIEVGIQEQWHEAAASPGQIWAGYRIVAIDESDAALLGAWLEQPDRS
ncbi:PilZ domain-containing protein [Dyella jiangningensis]|uniref:PilZ domain-containing protein n=1 Tax=Dyella jiangningensis TaxID=1379159 RepID=UPI0024107BD3|nr:PilZ domain-containing protein [Dyella jiangningensis]MDG2539188.1 PilZ domain-containing protein [Dyella jiangningensis]